MNVPTGIFTFIDELDDEQRAAAVAEENAVVSAGAGSGKTRVLTARYGWLVMTGRCKLEQLLTITFTNKAANEMYRRIYSLLSAYAPVNENARKAVENFHNARISTLDSFCMAIARTVCRRFGISPDFESDDVRVRELARSLALRFVLDKRNNPALQRLIAEKKMRPIADELFVQPVLYHSPISSPLDFKRFEKLQREEILKRWKEYTRLADGQIALIRENRSNIPQGNALDEHLAAALPLAVNAPGIEDLLADGGSQLRDQAAAYINFLGELNSFTFRNIGKNEAMRIMKEAMGGLKELHEKLEALANHAFQWDIVTAVFPLIEEYQSLLHSRKREAGILTFTDIAHLAVDGLRLYPDIRRMYQDSFRMIMIDEFQDNNSLQRDLVNLLADPARVFYVGDEKQSIYRFRGADVSVFRTLAEQAECKLSLNRNYRSHPALIRAFNRIFGGYNSQDDPAPAGAVFPPEGIPAENFEANYRWVKGGTQTNAAVGNSVTEKEAPRLHFAFFDKSSLNDPDDPLRAEDYEARYIAEKIKTLVSRGMPVFDKNTGRERPCAYADFAVLQRSHTHQRALERAFKLFDVPFNADRPSALFDDAPVNDMWAFLKLLVYPDDRVAYGALLRSPFVRLSEDAFTLCMLKGKSVFDESSDEQLPPQDARRYREARRLYRELLQDARNLPVSSLLTKLWYNEGYRHEALWAASSQVYLNLYDLFFEQAQTIEGRGKGLPDFLDYLEDLSGRKEKFDDSALPAEEEGGVRIMTIHRCKGLEFPVVFVYGCGSREDTSPDSGLALFSERWGIVLNLPQAEELPSGGDYFYLAEKDDYRAKTVAELRRLLYVAMTRAEQELFVSAIIPPQNKAERAELDPEAFEGTEDAFIARRFEQYRAKPDLQSVSFLRLLPDLNGENSLYTVEAITNSQTKTPQKHSAVDVSAGSGSIERLSMKKAALRVQGDYETIPLVPAYQFVPQTINASSLHASLSAMHISDVPIPAVQIPGKESFVQSGLNLDDECPDTLLRQIGLEPQEFGVIVHRFIEDRFNNRTPQIPPRFAARIGDNGQLAALAKAAQTMADGFFDSPLGHKAVSASFIKTEYPILTVVNRSNSAHDKVTISGKIDLLFDDGEVMYIVDFKTDREEDITRHAGQLAVYKYATEDIFGKPVECRLFYLRTRQEANLTGVVPAFSDSPTSP
jgi:ATP-dependent helicase/nuclease subunit A